MTVVICKRDWCKYPHDRYYAIILSMKESRIEPGLLQLFRWYAVLRIVLLALPSLHQVFDPDRRGRLDIEPDIFPKLLPNLLYVLLGMLVLLGYLSWPWLQRKFGRAYLPIAISIAMVGPIFEQEAFSPISNIWQPSPFLIIPIIFAAWQYNFRTVALFVFGSALLEFALSISFPTQAVFLGRPERVPESLIIYGRLLARTFSSLIVGFIVARLMRAQRQQRQELASANQKLLQHATTLEQLTVSRERNRLSRELHDTLAHTLSALAVQLEAIVTVWKRIPKKASAMLDQMLTTTRDGLNDTRRALQELRAAPLEELGLPLAIKSMAEEVANRSDLILTQEVSTTIDGLPPEVEQCYYRVAQEALENAAQHANATHLAITLVEDGSSVILIVADDGSGFNQDDIPDRERFGITGMRERAELVGAVFSLESSSGGGVTVRLVYQVAA